MEYKKIIAIVLLTITIHSCLIENVIGKGCTAVPLKQCGKDYTDNCMKCGTKSDYDCEKCCPGCTLETKGVYSYCTCKGPKPFPPGSDTWKNYRVAGMDVISVTGGSNETDYDKVIIMLHGGGGQGSDWEYQYEQGWFGDMSKLKYVFPTSALPGHVWYIDFKDPHCGLDDDCAYNISSIEESASRVNELIQHEMSLLSIGNDPSKVYLAGFSEGAQLTAYMQIAKLTFALGGVTVMDVSIKIHIYMIQLSL